jgi:FkbM family methyltransferase
MNPWIEPETVARLDIASGRLELGRIATLAARAAVPGIDIEIFWDGMWIRRVGPHYFPDPTMLSVAEPNWQRWIQTAEKYLRDADDYWFHLYQPHARDTIVDIGAGRGEDVFAFSRAVGAQGRVIAIEPHPVSFAALDLFCRLNRLDNVTRVQRACTEAPGDLQIETMPVWESNYVREGTPTATSHPVRCVRFDDLAAELGITGIDFLKMNIEGGERMALPGCTMALSRTRFLCVAAHDFRAARGEGEAFRTLTFVRKFLNDCGFHLATRDADPRYYVPYHVHGERPSSSSGARSPRVIC